MPTSRYDIIQIIPKIRAPGSWYFMIKRCFPARKAIPTVVTDIEICLIINKPLSAKLQPFFTVLAQSVNGFFPNRWRFGSFHWFAFTPVTKGGTMTNNAAYFAWAWITNAHKLVSL